MAYKPDLVRRMEEHNKKVKSEFERAERGEVINLTDLMISKEKIEVDMAGIEVLASGLTRKKR